MVSLMNNEMEKYGRKHPMSNLVQYLSMSPGIEEASKKPVKQSHDIMTEYFLIW